MKFIHLTDPHLTASGELFGIDVRRRLMDAVTSINTHHGDAALVMITGDMAHWGEPGAYEIGVETLDALSMPWYPLVGNHDIRENYLAGFPDALRTDDGLTYFKLAIEGYTLIALDTLTEGTHAGQINEIQLAWLDSVLSEIERDALLFMHHHPLVSGISGLDNIRLQNADDLDNVMMRHPGVVRHVFFGHMHRTFHGSWRGLPFSTVKSTAHQVHPNFEPGASLVSSSEEPAYAVVLVDAESVAIHDVSYLEEDKAFPYDREFGRPDS